MKNQKVTIIAGPCGLNTETLDELYRIADIRVVDAEGQKKPAIWGFRTVGLKSKTSLNKTGDLMGMDFHEYIHNAELIAAQKSFESFKMHPSIEYAKKLVADTGLNVSAEIMDPVIQLPLYEKMIPKGKLFIWNPAVNQLGYQAYIMGIYAHRNNWFVGLKNGKWFGENFDGKINMMEKNWLGQISFVTKDNEFLTHDRIVMIHRGIETVGKGKFRYPPVHDSADKVKKICGRKMFFDPSHSLGKLLRDDIVKETIIAMKMKSSDDEYLYDGILIEVGTSKTDTEQHITVEELQEMCAEIVKFRELTGPESNI